MIYLLYDIKLREFQPGAVLNGLDFILNHGGILFILVLNWKV